MGIQINGQTDIISATDGSLTVSGADLGSASASNLNISGIVTATEFNGNVTGNLTGTASTATAAATAYGLSGSPTLSGITSVSTTNLTVNGNAYPSDGSLSGARNRIINGDMQIDQRNNGASVTSTAAYTVDRWIMEESTDGAASVGQSTTAPTGFTNSLLWTTTTADASLGATQYTHLQQRIEGYNVSDLGFGTANAKTITLSFWVRSSLTGTFGGSLRNDGQDRCYPFTYEINSANTFEYKTITIPGDTTGTWLTNNGVGFRVGFSLGTGSTYLGAAGAWASSLYLGATGETSVIGTLNATWYITGVQLEAGTVATPFERRSYGQELALCQRYCQRFAGSSSICVGVTGSSTVAYFNIIFVQQMRAAPSLTVNTLGSIVKEGTDWYANTSILIATPTATHTTLQASQTNNQMTALAATRLGNGTDITFSAEL